MVDRQMKGAVLLSDVRSERLRLACDKCGRDGRYQVAGLIEKYGADVKLPDLRLSIAQCPKADAVHHIGDYCRVRWMGLET
jgi:hypothetical protein